MHYSIFIFYIFVSLFAPVKSTPCRRGFVPLRNSCYHFSEVVANWTEAGNRCQEMGARLVSIETTEETLDIHLHILYKFRNARYWTSGTDLEIQGQYTWSSTGKNFGISAWCPGQPDNVGEHCVEIYHADHHSCWNDLPCGVNFVFGLPMYFICEY